MMRSMLCRLASGLLFFALMAMVALFTISPEIQNNRITPVVIVFCGLFTIIFGMASLVENPGKGGTSNDDLHRAYQAGYELVDRQNQRHLDYQERAYGAQLAAQERQHARTVNAFVTLSLADKQLINRGLEAGMRLVQVNRRLAIQYADGHTQDVAEFEDLTPAKVRYMASAQERLLLPIGAGAGIAEGQYREI